jgi:hypothetical protein
VDKCTPDREGANNTWEAIMPATDQHHQAKAAVGQIQTKTRSGRIPSTPTSMIAADWLVGGLEGSTGRVMDGWGAGRLWWDRVGFGRGRCSSPCAGGHQLLRHPWLLAKQASRQPANALPSYTRTPSTSNSPSLPSHTHTHSSPAVHEYT